VERAIAGITFHKFTKSIRNESLVISDRICTIYLLTSLPKEYPKSLGSVFLKTIRKL
jgi:hypothetical protein